MSGGSNGGSVGSLLKKVWFSEKTENPPRGLWCVNYSIFCLSCFNAFYENVISSHYLQGHGGLVLSTSSVSVRTEAESDWKNTALSESSFSFFLLWKKPMCVLPHQQQAATSLFFSSIFQKKYRFSFWPAKTKSKSFFFWALLRCFNEKYKNGTFAWECGTFL